MERSAISESRRPRRFHSAASRDARRWGPCCSRPPRAKRSVSSITGRPAQATTSRGIPPRGSPPARSSPSSRCVSQLHPMKPTRLPAHACAPHSPSFPVHRIHRRCSYSRSSRHRTRVSASKGRSRRPRSRRRRVSPGTTTRPSLSRWRSRQLPRWRGWVSRRGRTRWRDGTDARGWGRTPPCAPARTGARLGEGSARSSATRWPPRTRAASRQSANGTIRTTPVTPGSFPRVHRPTPGRCASRRGSASGTPSRPRVGMPRGDART